MAIQFLSGRLPLRYSALPILMLALCGCSTTITSSANPSRDIPSHWADIDTLPVAVHGSVPGVSGATLASLFPRAPSPEYASLGNLPPVSGGRRVVLYINASELPPKAALCSAPGDFTAGVQAGQLATVTGALCDGPTVITRASARVLTAGQSPDELRRSLEIVTDQLYYSLYRGANDPMRYYN